MFKVQANSLGEHFDADPARKEYLQALDALICRTVPGLERWFYPGAPPGAPGNTSVIKDGELGELDIDREGIEGVKASAIRTARPPSAWWWLLPPVMYVLRRRWNTAFRQAVGETWQVIERHSWPVWLFWLLIVVMLAVSMLNTAARTISQQHTRHPAGAEPASAAEPR
jgi:hypothetical protein